MKRYYLGHKWNNRGIQSLIAEKEGSERESFFVLKAQISVSIKDWISNNKAHGLFRLGKCAAMSFMSFICSNLIQHKYFS